VASIALPAPRDAVDLYPGCNNIALSFPDGTACDTVVDAVTPAGVVGAMWRHNAALNKWDGFSPAAPAASDLKTVNLWDAVWLCVARAPAPAPTATVPPAVPTATPPSPTPTVETQPPPPVPGTASAKEAYPLALQAARARRPDAYLEHVYAGCGSSPFGGFCFEGPYHEMASGDGRSEEWTFWLHSPAAQEGLWVDVKEGQATEPDVSQETYPPDRLPLDEMIDSTEAVRIADANGGNAYKAAGPGNRLCGAQISGYNSEWQIDYCPPFDQGGKGLVVIIDARTGEVKETEESTWS
jgi:hypothetical protein